MATMTITIEADDVSDLDFLRARIEGSIQEVIEDNRERLDGHVADPDIEIEDR